LEEDEVVFTELGTVIYLITHLDHSKGQLIPISFWRGEVSREESRGEVCGASAIDLIIVTLVVVERAEEVRLINLGTH
jgi:hypothetical protein